MRFISQRYISIPLLSGREALRQNAINEIEALPYFSIGNIGYLGKKYNKRTLYRTPKT